MSEKLTAKDFASDQDIRWCPGCGDFAILKQTQMVLAKTGANPDKTVFISGIGCSSRFPYYMNTYGMHSIHGRATAIATGLKKTRPDLDVWVVTGDGDALSIGGNHLIHLLRRDIDVNVLLFNNEIYGLTKGQYSPTSKQNLVTKSSPFGNDTKPFNTLSLVLGAGASFVARSIDREAKHLQNMLVETKNHVGTSFLEIYQNCHIFNDGTFENYTDKALQRTNTLFLEDGKPLIFGKNEELGMKFDGLTPIVVNRAEVSDSDLWIHNRKDKIKANILCSIVDIDEKFPKLFGVIYESKDAKQLEEKLSVSNKEYINSVIKGNNYWSI